MCLARKLLVFAATAITALALTAGTASAQLEIQDEETSGQCSEVSLVGHVVEGGCHVEFQSEEHITFVIYFPVPIAQFTCNWHLDAWIGANGSGYVTQAALTDEFPPADRDCLHEPCDEPTHEMIPWPIQISEAAGAEIVELDFCYRLISFDEEGGNGTRCELHLPLSVEVNHSYAFGNHDEYACEIPVFPPLPATFQDVDFINEDPPDQGTEDIEIIH